MDYKRINELLKDLELLRKGKAFQIEVIKKIEEEANQGDEGLSYEYYKINNEDDVYIQLTITTDSYGDNESISGVQFVRPTNKTILVFETI